VGVGFRGAAAPWAAVLHAAALAPKQQARDGPPEGPLHATRGNMPPCCHAAPSRKVEGRQSTAALRRQAAGARVAALAVKAALTLARDDAGRQQELLRCIWKESCSGGCEQCRRHSVSRCYAWDPILPPPQATWMELRRGLSQCDGPPGHIAAELPPPCDWPTTV
jgi:hypothetical protein